MFKNIHEINGKVAHAFSIAWGEWSMRDLYLHYWLKILMNHSTPIWMLSEVCFVPWKMGVVEIMVIEVLCVSILNMQKSMFKIIMKSNAKATFNLLHTINLLTKIWRIIINFSMFFQILKYLKLVKVVIIQVLGSMEDEWVFSDFHFIKCWIFNWLTKHLVVSFHVLTIIFYNLQFSLRWSCGDLAIEKHWYVLNA